MAEKWKRDWQWDGAVARRFHKGIRYRAHVVIDQQGLSGQGKDKLLGVAMGCIKDDDCRLK